MNINRESLFLSKVKKDLDYLPDCWYYKTNQRSTRGLPDIIGVVNSNFFALELKIKKPSSKPTLQKFTLEQINECNGFAKLVYPDIWETVLDELRAL